MHYRFFIFTKLDWFQVLQKHIKISRNTMLRLCIFLHEAIEKQKLIALCSAENYQLSGGTKTFFAPSVGRKHSSFHCPRNEGYTLGEIDTPLPSKLSDWCAEILQ